MKKSVLMAMLLMVATGLMFVSCQKDNFGDEGGEEVGETTYTIWHTQGGTFTYQCIEYDRNGDKLVARNLSTGIRTFYPDEKAVEFKVYASFTTKTGRYLEYPCGGRSLKKGKDVVFKLESVYKSLNDWYFANYEY